MPKLHDDVQAVCHTKVGRISVIIKLGEFCCQTLPNSTEHLWTFFSGFTLQCIGKKTLYGWQKPQAFATPQKFKVPFLRWVNAKFLSECFERFTLVSVNSGFGKDITIITEIFTTNRLQRTERSVVTLGTNTKRNSSSTKHMGHGSVLNISGISIRNKKKDDYPTISALPGQIFLGNNCCSTSMLWRRNTACFIKCLRSRNTQIERL